MNRHFRVPFAIALLGLAFEPCWTLRESPAQDGSEQDVQEPLRKLTLHLRTETAAPVSATPVQAPEVTRLGDDDVRRILARRQSPT
jgi:hypothetical protein